jgi:hypothetical protein
VVVATQTGRRTPEYRHGDFFGKVLAHVVLVGAKLLPKESPVLLVGRSTPVFPCGYREIGVLNRSRHAQDGKKGWNVLGIVRILAFLYGKVSVKVVIGIRLVFTEHGEISFVEKKIDIGDFVMMTQIKEHVVEHIIPRIAF